MNLWQADVVRVEERDLVVVFDGDTDEAKVPSDRVARLPDGFCDPLAGCRGSGGHQRDANGGKGVGAPVEQDPEKAFAKSLKVGDTALFKAKEFGASNHYQWTKATVSGRNGDALIVKVSPETEARNAFPSDLRPLRALKRAVKMGTLALWEDQPERWVGVWVADATAEDGSLEVTVHGDPKARGGEGGEKATLTKEQAAKLSRFAPADL
ncbi:MAG: hypothetical protein IT374_25670 [Polyangiaceae bacterium]|nr:hypothetical protein [Polyangiaceae bacterium]